MKKKAATGKQKTYRVIFNFAGWDTYEVKAVSEQEAIKKARGMGHDDATDSDWTMYDLDEVKEVKP